jgi:hypothetical protein
MMAALQQQLVSAQSECLFDFYLVGFNVSDVAFFMPWSPEKITEFTVGDANIGSINVAVDLPGYFSAGHLLLSQFISNKCEFSSCCVMVKKNTFFLCQEVEMQGPL